MSLPTPLVGVPWTGPGIDDLSQRLWWNGRAMHVAALDPAWWVDARLDTDALTEQVSDATATHADPVPSTLDRDSWTGTPLVGNMRLTAGAPAEWFTDLDCSGRAGLLPLESRKSANDPDVAQIAIVFESVASDPFCEVTWLLGNAGEVRFMLDGHDTTLWQSAPLEGFDWRDGWAPVDFRIRVVAATGAVTLTIDGTTITDTLDAAEDPPWGTPTAGDPVQAGSDNGYPVLVESFEFLDGIDGDPIISFDATATTGWEIGTNGTGQPTGPPARAAWLGANALGYSLASAAAFNVAADADATWVFSLRPIDNDQNPIIGRNINGMFGGQAGWALLAYSGFGIAWQFRITDGTDAVGVELGTISDDDQVITVVLDRDADTLTAYVDGVQTDQADASALGAVSPTAALEVGRSTSLVYAAAGFDRALTAEERAGAEALFGP